MISLVSSVYRWLSRTIQARSIKRVIVGKVKRLYGMCAVMVLLSVLMGACTISNPAGIDSAAEHPAISLSSNAHWLLDEFDNESSQATAGLVMSTLLETHLRRSGIESLNTVHDSSHFRVTGRVRQWHYLPGAVSRPVISMSVQVKDIETDDVVWSGERDMTGKRRESLTVLADRLLAELLHKMPIDNSAAPVTGTDSDNSALADAGYLDLVSPSGKIPLPGQMALRDGSQWYRNSAVKTDRPLSGRSIAFYYGADPDVEILSQFDRLVLEPDNISEEQLVQLTAESASAFAYLSVGEVGPSREYASELLHEWILGSNPAWSSSILDLSDMELRAFLLNRVGMLDRAGYQGVFLDTMDSYQLVTKTPEERSEQQAGLISLISSISIRYPSLRIIVNRGFEVLDDIAGQVEAVAAESLYASWNNEAGEYTTVSNADRAWLIDKLRYAQQQLNLDVIAIDYVPPHKRTQAREVATKITRLGFIPWVATPSLDYIGVGALEVVPRKVLMLYDSQVDGLLANTSSHTLLAMPIEYLGYVPVYLDISKDALPAGELKGRFAGIVTWPRAPYSHPDLQSWLQRQLDSQVPVAFFSVPPVEIDETMADSLGIELAEPLDPDSASLVFKDRMFDPERTPPTRYDDFGLVARSVIDSNTTHLRFRDHKGQTTDPVVTGSFGGFAWQPVLVDDGVDYAYWLLDPFRFIKKALQLPDVPQPDVTTENGKRLWLAHIDGDALVSWAEMPGRQLGMEVLYDRIFTRYQLPHTISVVEAEMTSMPQYADRRKRMFAIARKTFELDHVHVGSHTYSHPFNWEQVARYKRWGKYNLDVKGYLYSSEREVAGSIDFINRELVPPGKRVEVMLWSGNALPQVDDLKEVEKLGIVNMNGGSTSMSRRFPSISRVSAMARTVDDLVQVYAPIMNENMFTNDWTGPFDGFRDVIGTFEMTDKPRRLKPINVYYHFYSGTKTASLKALEDVYGWSTAQDIHPVHVKDYALKVPDFRDAGVARYLDGHWKISRLGDVRSLRLLSHRGWPDLDNSQGIAGARQLHDGLYLHTDGSDTVTFQTGSVAPRQVHLVASNGRVLKWRNLSNGLLFRVKAEVPVIVELGGSAVTACTVSAGADPVRGVRTKTGTVVFTFTLKDTGDAILNCQA